MSRKFTLQLIKKACKTYVKACTMMNSEERCGIISQIYQCALISINKMPFKNYTLFLFKCNKRNFFQVRRNLMYDVISKSLNYIYTRISTLETSLQYKLVALYSPTCTVNYDRQHNQDDHQSRQGTTDNGYQFIRFHYLVYFASLCQKEENNFQTAMSVIDD